MPTLATVFSRGAAKDAILAALFVEEQLVLSVVDASSRRVICTPELRADIEAFRDELVRPLQEQEDDADARRGVELWEREHGIGLWGEDSD